MNYLTTLRTRTIVDVPHQQAFTDCIIYLFSLLVTSFTSSTEETTMKMTVHHVLLERDFTQIHNSLITDTSISAEARLTLIYLLSRPDGWKTWRNDLRSKMSIGDFKYRRIMKELTAAGYVEVLAGGIGGGAQIIIYEGGKERCVGKPHSGKTAWRETNAHSNTDLETNTNLKPKNSCSFEQFYEIYPRKVGRKAAAKAWKANKCQTNADHIIADVLNRTEHDEQWQDKKYIPHPATYLNGEKWNDDVTPKSTTELDQIWQHNRDFCQRENENVVDSHDSHVRPALGEGIRSNGRGVIPAMAAQSVTDYD